MWPNKFYERGWEKGSDGTLREKDHEGLLGEVARSRITEDEELSRWGQRVQGI